MPEPGETPATEPDSFRLSCGAEKTNLKRGWWSISDGAFHPETPSGIIYSPGIGTTTNWLSGEALIFPPDKGTTLIVGRASELKIDADLVDTSTILSKYSGGTTKKVGEYLDALTKLDNAVKAKEGGAGVEKVADFGDVGISRHHLQISNHPEGVTVVTYDPSLGIRPENYDQPKSERINFPTVLMQYDKEPATRRLNWTTFEGAATLRDGDVIIIEGATRIYCLRFFAAKGDKPPMFVKQAYPLNKPIEELHEELIVNYAKQKGP